MARDSDVGADSDRDQIAEWSAGDFGLARTIEALLFVADRALSATEISGITGASESDVREALRRLSAHYRTRGVVLLEHRNAFRLVSAPDLADYCRRLLGLDQRRQPSRAALETLGIVAYRGRATRAEIERVRGRGLRQRPGHTALAQPDSGSRTIGCPGPAGPSSRPPTRFLLTLA